MRWLVFGGVAYVGFVVVLCAFLRAASGTAPSRVVRSERDDFRLWERELAGAAQ